MCQENLFMISRSDFDKSESDMSLKVGLLEWNTRTSD